MAQEQKKQDMGSGSIPKLMFSLAVPAVVAQLINMLYNIVDRIYIGHIPDAGASALTGVGLFLPILMMINAFAMLAGSGGAPSSPPSSCGFLARATSLFPTDSPTHGSTSWEQFL